MKPAVLCLLLLAGCLDHLNQYNYRAYRLTWTCLSPGGCERAEQVALIDRVEIVNGSDLVDFLITREPRFRERAQMVPSDALPADCSWLYSFTLFASELEPSVFCRTSGGLELELSIPDRDPATQSEWFVEGEEIDP